MNDHLDIIQIWIDGKYDKAINLLKEQPVIVQYYLTKGLKLAKKDVFYAAFRGSVRGAIQHRVDYIENILVEVYNCTKENKWGPDYFAAEAGMGNLDAYVTAIKEL